MPTGFILTISVPTVCRRIDAASGHNANERGALPVSRRQNSLVHIYPALLVGSGALISTGVIRGFSNVFL